MTDPKVVKKAKKGHSKEKREKKKKKWLVKFFEEVISA